MYFLLSNVNFVMKQSDSNFVIKFHAVTDPTEIKLVFQHVSHFQKASRC